MTESSGSNKHVPSKGPLKLDWTIGLQLADTTWRVAVPILLLTYIGHKMDVGFGTNPLFIMSGLFLSLAIAIFLVYRQIKIAYPDFFKKEFKK